MAQFAQPTPDENLSPGWNVQGTGSAQSTTGVPGQGYAQAAPVGAGITTGQAGAGLPNPPGAGNIGAENSGAYGVSVLSNPGYATGSGSFQGTLTAPLPTTTGVQSPYGMNAMAAVTGAAITSVSVAPFTTGTPQYTVVSTVTASANPITVSVPPGGFIKTVGGNATAVVYTPVS
jgi:hypothetical protein